MITESEIDAVREKAAIRKQFEDGWKHADIRLRVEDL
jgi:hypothetical protein